mmetsp:Transcript_24569/g.50414  ORF Transcript_24569/g.50414 Transcript_24569/m.50414 type:complete len:244 (-) Transcript_24569:458-1189(-)
MPKRLSFFFGSPVLPSFYPPISNRLPATKTPQPDTREPLAYLNPHRHMPHARKHAHGASFSFFLPSLFPHSHTSRHGHRDHHDAPVKTIVTDNCSTLPVYCCCCCSASYCYPLLLSNQNTRKGSSSTHLGLSARPPFPPDRLPLAGLSEEEEGADPPPCTPAPAPPPPAPPPPPEEEAPPAPVAGVRLRSDMAFSPDARTGFLLGSTVRRLSAYLRPPSVRLRLTAASTLSCEPRSTNANPRA